MSFITSKSIGKEEEIENIKITKEFFEFISEKEIQKANSYKNLNEFHYKEKIQNNRSLKKAKIQEDIKLEKEKHFQIFKKEEIINYKNKKTILKTNFNNLFDFNF